VPQNRYIFLTPIRFLKLFFTYFLISAFRKGPLTKNGPIDFAQSWAIHMKKSNKIYGGEKKGGSFTFLGP
jgi:hypothetical protein